LFSLSTDNRQGNIIFPVGSDFPDDSGPSGKYFSLTVLNRQEKNHLTGKSAIIAFSI
jgi:hypothetical protein